MGIEITVNNLDDMCRLMCDNVIPDEEITSFDFGIWMKSKRKERQLSQADLASMVNVHATSIGRWERGDDYPTLDKVEEIAKILGAKIFIRSKGEDNDRQESI